MSQTQEGGVDRALRTRKSVLQFLSHDMYLLELIEGKMLVSENLSWWHRTLPACRWRSFFRQVEWFASLPLLLLTTCWHDSESPQVETFWGTYPKRWLVCNQCSAAEPLPDLVIPCIFHVISSLCSSMSSKPWTCARRVALCIWIRVESVVHGAGSMLDTSFGFVMWVGSVLHATRFLWICFHVCWGSWLGRDQIYSGHCDCVPRFGWGQPSGGHFEPGDPGVASHPGVGV